VNEEHLIFPSMSVCLSVAFFSLGTRNHHGFPKGQREPRSLHFEGCSLLDVSTTGFVSAGSLPKVCLILGLCPQVLLPVALFQYYCYLTFEMRSFARVITFRRRFCGTPRPSVDDFAGHPVLLTHLPDGIVNVIGGSYTHAHTLPHPKRHKTKYRNFMAMNKQREMLFK
jgi:hypothetical protein